MIILDFTSKLALTLMIAIGLTPQYASALDCYAPSISERVQPVIDNPQTSAIVRGKLKLPSQKYSYDWGEFFSRYSATRSLQGTIDGYIATASGFSKAVSVQVTLKEDCNRWPDTNICVKSESVDSSVETTPSIYFLDITKKGYVLTSGDCAMNSIEANPEDIKEIATCFINGGC